MFSAAQREVIGTLLGRKSGPLISSPGYVRDVIGGHAYKVCLELELAGIGRVEVINPHAFTFKTHAMIRAEQEKQA